MSNATATTPLQDAASADQDNVAEVRELTKYYGEDVHALDSINLGFPRGENHFAEDHRGPVGTNQRPGFHQW